MLQSWEEVYFTKRRIVGCGTLISRGKANKGDFCQTSLFVTLIVMPSLEPVLAGRLLPLTRDHQEVACGLPPRAICGYRAQSWLEGRLIKSLIAEGEKPDEILSKTAVAAT
jgi:hypothetical protein